MFILFSVTYAVSWEEWWTYDGISGKWRTFVKKYMKTKNQLTEFRRNIIMNSNEITIRL